ncbi:hypothetical protein C8J56DRAFT_734960, partial [Mycena floridula]
LLVEEFRSRYSSLRDRVTDSLNGEIDIFPLTRLAEDLDRFIATTNEHGYVLDGAEHETLTTNLLLMQQDLQSRYDQVLDNSHRGHPSVLQTVRTGAAGRPRTIIDPAFLQFAYAHRTTSSIARFLGLSRETVRRQLLDEGIVVAGQFPMNLINFDDDSSDPEIASIPVQGPIPTGLSVQASNRAVSDEALDELISGLRAHFRRAGIRILITGLRAIDNNRASSILELFLDA